MLLLLRMLRLPLQHHLPGLGKLGGCHELGYKVSEFGSIFFPTFSRKTAPHKSENEVTSNTFAAGVHKAQIELSPSKSLFSGLAIPLRRLGVIPWDT